MNCTTLNQTLIGAFRRTNASTTAVLRPLISIGAGWGKSATEANRGMKTTVEITLANESRRNHASHNIAVMAKAVTAFRIFTPLTPLNCKVLQSENQSRMAAQPVSTTSNAYKLGDRISFSAAVVTR